MRGGWPWTAGHGVGWEHLRSTAASLPLWREGPRQAQPWGRCLPVTGSDRAPPRQSSAPGALSRLPSQGARCLAGDTDSSGRSTQRVGPPRPHRRSGTVHADDCTAPFDPELVDVLGDRRSGPSCTSDDVSLTVAVGLACGRSAGWARAEAPGLVSGATTADPRVSHHLQRPHGLWAREAGGACTSVLEAPGLWPVTSQAATPSAVLTLGH